nr:LysR substrate-binding domain-containing protein [uncultured Halomonas sp.]
MIQQSNCYMPSLQALRAFDALARLGSLTEAADALNLTRSAISHQMRLLEDQLGLKLYERRGRGVILTPTGQQYAHEIRRVLAMLDHVHANLPDHEYNGHLRVSMPPGFAASVVSRSINDFYRNYPGIRLHIGTNRENEPPNPANLDLFVVHGDGAWAEHSVEMLAHPMYTPVCSPGLLNELQIKHPQDLERATLLHLNNDHDWRLWLSGSGTKAQLQTESGVYFTNILLVISAAITGQGIAIGDDVVCGDTLKRGQLVRPFDMQIRGDKAYYLVTPHRNADDPKVRAFSDWLKVKLNLFRQA